MMNIKSLMLIGLAFTHPGRGFEGLLIFDSPQDPFFDQLN